MNAFLGNLVISFLEILQTENLKKLQISAIIYIESERDSNSPF